VAAICGIFRLWPRVTALKGEAERDLAFELSPHSLEQRENRTGYGSDLPDVAGGERCEVGGGALQLASQRSIKNRLRRRRCLRAIDIASAGQRLETAAGIQKRAADFVGSRSST
jgi:hypothetical protein